MKYRVLLLSLVALLYVLVFITSPAHAIALQLPFEIGQTWGMRTYDDHNCWGPYDDKAHAIDWFLVTSIQTTCPHWASTYSNSQGQNLRAACAVTIYMIQNDKNGCGDYSAIRKSEEGRLT